MLTDQQKALIKATIPVLEEHGITLTTHFYARMFSYNPELKHLFNQGHQNSGRQQVALASAVLAYAEHIENPSILLPVLERIAHKHASLNIRAEQYNIVGVHLLASIQEVLGDAASEELIAAWGVAYQMLADQLVQMESDLYQQSVMDLHGWSGWRPFRITQKVVESDEITSFYLEPVDGGRLPKFEPGQYVSVRIYVKSWDLFQPRQYSLSDSPNSRYLRISVKREAAESAWPAGQVSNILHENYNVGQLIELSSPNGDFKLNAESDKPVVLLSGGVGITPMMSIASHLVQEKSNRPVHFVHAARNAKVHAFKSVTDQWHEQSLANVQYFYDHVTDHDIDVQAGLIDLEEALPFPLSDAEYYLCGPAPFMYHYLNELKRLGIQDEQIYAEAFGSGGIQLM